MNFNAADLVDPDPEPPVLRWVNPQQGELAIILRDPGEPTRIDLLMSSLYIPGSQELDQRLAARIGDSFNVSRPARFLHTSEPEARIRALQQMQLQCPGEALRIQDQIDALIDSLPRYDTSRR